MGKKTSILHREQVQKSLQPKHHKKKQARGASTVSDHIVVVKPWACASIVSKQAAAIVRRILAADASRRADASIRSLTLAPSVQAKKATHAVVCETLRNLELLRSILGASELLSKHAALTEEVAYVLLYDLLLGQQAANCADVSVDEHLKDVLVFEPSVELHDHPLVVNTSLILQGKASCMAAHALNPQAGWTVVDACAAPGNKTSHLAGLMEGKGRVLAFDKDAARCKRLKDNMGAAGASIVSVQHADFLSLDFADPCFTSQGVQAALVDPSCSGSGTAHSRLDHLLPSAAAAARESSTTSDAAPDADRAVSKRVQRLAAFQERILRHALHLPGLQRLVYSTCSLHPEENEIVVQAVLPEASSLGFRLATALPDWPCRGLPLVQGSECLLRTDPEKHKMDGFFVALFVRDL
ncbi:hypothetical protein WJX73_009331 [Symbiochloris irregularis]|uniref:SAM-dependent MTase RsmB/NOP-type domain-containing protein n=1 Tax=Symbiochloris irregularis TaxID=706552 RepID=A0AAW1PH21_9CHLO